MTIFTTGPRASGGHAFSRLALALALALAAALAIQVVPAHAASSGSVSLGVRVSAEPETPASGATGSVDLGIGVGYDVIPQNSTVGSGEKTGQVDLGVNVATLGSYTVQFKGYEYSPDGSLVSQSPINLNADQIVGYGEHAIAPANVTRTYQVDGKTHEYWLDGWYEKDPTVYTDAADNPARSLSDIAITGPATLYCQWKTDYFIKLDAANNGVAARAGVVDHPGGIHLARADAASGGAFTYDAVPHATRPGYTFAGWYWPETNNNGNLVLDKDGNIKLAKPCLVPDDVEVPEGNPRTLAYGDVVSRFEAQKGMTLYAKWELDPAVRIVLQNDKSSADEADRVLWFWPGRGYTYYEPEYDDETSTKFVALTEPGKLDNTKLGIAHNPVPKYSTQVFIGWGYESGRHDESGNVDDRFIECVKDEGASTYSYALTDRAFASDYVGPGLSWVDVTHTTEEDIDTDAGAAATVKRRTTIWDALFDTAQIRVRAPFEVTFEKAGGAAYALDELEYKGGNEWIFSQEQTFTNLGENKVYISGVECTDVGASAILPGGTDGRQLFSLDGQAGSLSGKAIKFGYAPVSGYNKVTVNRSDASKWIELPAVVNGQETGVPLYYGLDLSKAAFNRAAIAVGYKSSSADTSTSYVAKLANVKYTYSVVP